MSARGRHADASACGTCRKAVEAGEAVVHEECAARAALLQAPDYPDYEDLLDLTDDERRALPARFHTPHFDSVGTPNAWLCRVCWGDGWVTQWPCKAAQENGTQVFTHAAFVGDSATELVELRARVSTLSDELSGACLARYEEEQENARLLAERHSTNEALSDAVEALKVQQARIAELEALTPAPIQTCQTCGAGYDLGQPCSVCAFHVLMEIAEKKQRQQEDPHTSELHHDYALGRDLPFVPQQLTGRCPKGHTFEDCTCGGAA